MTPLEDLRALQAENAALRRQVAELGAQLMHERSASGPLPFDVLFDTLPVPLVLYRHDGTAVAINRANEALIGTPREAIIGHHNIFRDPQAVEQGYLDCFMQACSGKVVKMPPTSYDTAQALLDGRVEDRLIWSETTYFPLYDATGALVLVGEINQDVTERRRAEEALSANRALLAAIVDQLPGYIYVKDNAGRYMLVNRSFADVVERDIENILGKTDYELFDDATARRYQALDQYVLTHGQAAEEEQSAVLHGSLRHLLTVKFPLTNRAGTHYAVAGVTTDITARKHDEAERLQFERKLLETQKLESLGLLAGGIAHDFNNLLVAILGNASLALEDLPRDAPARASIEHIQVAARRAADLTRQMLAYAGKGRFIVQPLHLNQLVQEMTHLLHTSLAKNVTLHYHLAPELPMIEGDITQLQQIVMNLVVNAAEAIADKQGVVTISTRLMHVRRSDLAQMIAGNAMSEGPYTCLEIADTGVGMDAETRAKIFEPFFTTKFTGRGLGLAAVLGIVRGHKGAINVYSTPGQGTTFKILLPALAVAPVAPVLPPSLPVQQWQGTVLVIDDELDIRQVTTRMLERLGFVVVVAPDGPSGIKEFEANKANISLVLLDMTMPRLNGEETFDRLRQIQPNVRVILMSGYNEQETTNQFAGKGLAGFLPKPFTPSDLRERLRQVLG